MRVRYSGEKVILQQVFSYGVQHLFFFFLTYFSLTVLLPIHRTNNSIHREKVEDDYERRMDILMELDRIRDIRNREADESQKLARRLADRTVISAQIAGIVQ